MLLRMHGDEPAHALRGWPSYHGAETPAGRVALRCSHLASRHPGQAAARRRDARRGSAGRPARPLWVAGGGDARRTGRAMRLLTRHHAAPQDPGDRSAPGLDEGGNTDGAARAWR